MSTAQRLIEIEAKEKELAEEKKKLLEASKVADLEMVRWHSPNFVDTIHNAI